MFYLLLQINNAGILGDPNEVTLENAKSVLATNYFAVKDVTKTLLPLLRDDTPGGARVIVVGSRIAQLKVTCMGCVHVPQQTQERVFNLFIFALA
jgi:NAD(P)-dependent dehydrogenase (short-subunit alcohol dehydrogenase family)